MQLILDPMHQNGFIVTGYDEEGLRLATTEPCPTPALAFAKGRNIVDNKISRGLRSGSADAPVPKDVRFSNRPFGVKRFQTIHHRSEERRVGKEGRSRW